MKVFLASAALAAAVLLSPVASRAASGDLIKIPCVGGEDASDPCRAVYYHGGDGRRHAFPNERVYFTWYANFNAVKTISPGEMAAIPLGENVTYKPGSKLVKFLTENKVYAVAGDRTLRWVTSESAAQGLFGQGWAKGTDDIADVFYTDYVFGSPINHVDDFNRTAENAAAPNIDAALFDSYRAYKITTPRGSFDVQVISVRKSRYGMVTDVASPAVDCADGCAAKSLADYAASNGATIGIHGTYFCPPDYADCQGKTNTFLSPFFRTADRAMFNVAGLQWHKGPMLAYFSDGSWRFVRSAGDIKNLTSLESMQGAQVVAAVSNYPALMEGGSVVVDAEPLLDDGQRNNKGTRAGIGTNDSRIFLIVARSATVPDLASIFAAVGARDALNLDGGGSTALLYGGAYKTGPGRLLPNAILLKAR